MKKPKKKGDKQKPGNLASAIVENCCIYFYYLAKDKNNKLICRSYYFFDRSVNLSTVEKLRQQIIVLSANARIDGDYPPCHGDRFSDLAMRKRDSFYVVVVDDEEYKFSQDDPLRLKTVEKYPVDASYTFSKSYELDLDMSGYETGPDSITAAYRKNYLKNRLGNVLNENESESFNLYLNPGIPTIVPDSGGTNMGPPVPPP